MITQIASAAVRGVEAYPVRVEVSVAGGLPSFTVVGLPRGAVREGRERVTSALRTAGVTLPPRRITVNLAPADVRKEGSALDLPIAIALAAAVGALEPARLRGLAFVGELGLDGRVRPVRGALAVARACRDAKLTGLVVPEENGPEAAAVQGVEVHAARRLDALLADLAGGGMSRIRVDPSTLLEGERSGPDLSEVRGHAAAKRALEVAAAGGHNLLLYGPPGSGKTMLARRLAGILPGPDLDEALEVATVYSVAGLLPPGHAVLPGRPFRAPHHTVSYAGLVGGGTPPRPGEISLAHRGVLFLDELPEFRRSVLESLRQPLEDGHVTISRASGSVRFPSDLLLVAAMNPCRCGWLGHESERCTCDPGDVRRYRSRVSGPLLDRLDLHVEVPAVPFRELSGEPGGSGSAGSAAIRRRVRQARRRQRARFSGGGVRCNGEMGARELRRHCRPSRAVARLLQHAVDRLGLSARAYHRILKVARTVADLEGEDGIRERHAAEAIQYRSLDRRGEM